MFKNVINMVLIPLTIHCWLSTQERTLCRATVRSFYADSRRLARASPRQRYVWSLPTGNGIADFFFGCLSPKKNTIFSGPVCDPCVTHARVMRQSRWLRHRRTKYVWDIAEWDFFETQSERSIRLLGFFPYLSRTLFFCRLKNDIFPTNSSVVSTFPFKIMSCLVSFLYLFLCTLACMLGTFWHLWCRGFQ